MARTLALIDDATGERFQVELVGVREIADFYGRTRACVTNWARRFEDYPVPVVPLAATPVWNLFDVMAWCAAHGFERNDGE